MPDEHPIVERQGQECPDCGFQAEGRWKKWCPRCKEGLLFDIVFEHPTGPIKKPLDAALEDLSQQVLGPPFVERIDMRFKWLYNIVTEKEIELGKKRHELIAEMDKNKGSFDDIPEDLRIHFLEVDYAIKVLNDIIPKMNRAILFITDHPEMADKLCNDFISTFNYNGVDK